MRSWPEEKTISEIARETEAHPNMISKWKRELIDNADSAFRNGKSENEKEFEKGKDEIYEQIGKLHAENDFLKKLKENEASLRTMIEPERENSSISDQCSLLGREKVASDTTMKNRILEPSYSDDIFPSRGKSMKNIPPCSRNMDITHTNQVWASDIVCIPGGIVYVATINRSL